MWEDWILKILTIGNIKIREDDLLDIVPTLKIRASF